MASGHFILRAFAYTCAFVGAGWFGLMVYQSNTWTRDDTWIVVPAAVVGLLIAAVTHARRTRAVP